jgi:hypothetical protein
MRLREIVLSLGGVEERTLYDHFCREWTPAFYTRGTQLCHVHDFGADLRATMFVGMKTLEPFIMASDSLSKTTAWSPRLPLHATRRNSECRSRP